MKKILTRHIGKKNIYIHNDLSNAAYYFKEKIETKLKTNDLEGIIFEYMACLIMLAFTFEAEINFLGHKLITNWKERRPFENKITEVFKYLKIDPDWSIRPYSSIKMIKKFRDLLAHGKPYEIEFSKKVANKNKDIFEMIELDSKWVSYCAHDNVFNAYSDLKIIWKELLHIAKISQFETITHSISGIISIK